jgi:hypothetical protein
MMAGERHVAGDLGDKKVDFTYSSDRADLAPAIPFKTISSPTFRNGSH